MKFKNVNTDVILTEEELDRLHEKEYREMWNNDDQTTWAFKDENKTIDEYLAYMYENDYDTDFIVIEE